jgi:hypothetical protein
MLGRPFANASKPLRKLNKKGALRQAHYYTHCYNYRKTPT